MSKRLLLWILGLGWALGSATGAAAFTLGSGVTLPVNATIRQLCETPDAHLGKTIAVEGWVVSRCAVNGCWMELAGEDSGCNVLARVRGKSSVVFPYSAKGKKVRVQGTFESAVPSSEEEVEMARQRAASGASPGDGAKTTPAPVKEFRILVTGAEIPD